MTDRKPPMPPPPGHRRPGGPPPNTGEPRLGPPRTAPLRPAPGPRRPAPPPSPPRGRGGSVFLVGLALVLALAGGVATWLVLAPPVDFIRDQVAAGVKARTGRDLLIAGPASISFYPALGVKLEKVSLGAPPQMGGAPTVQMKSLDVEVKLAPLLSRKVEVERVVLHAPEFDLRVDRNGRKSWQFADAFAAPARVRYAQAPTATRTDAATGGAPASSSGLLEEISLGDVRIVGGILRYADERSGAARTVSGIDMRFTARTLASPLEAKGSVDLQGQKTAVEAKLTSLQAVLQDRPAKLALQLSNPAGSLAFDGSIAAEGDAAEGMLNASTPSLRRLGQWLGAAMPAEDQGFGPASVEGRVKANATAIAFSDANFALDGAVAKGTLAVEFAKPLPLVKASLRVGELDLNRYMSDGAPAAGEHAGGAKPAAKAAPPPPGADGDPIGDLLKREPAGPQVKGYTKRDGWSDEPFPVAALAAVDVDARLAIGKLTYKELKIGPSQVQVSLRDRVLETKFEDMQLYQGRGRGIVALDGRGATPTLGANFLVENVAGKPFFQDAADLDWLEGTGKLSLAVTGRGVSQRQVIDTLNGNAQFVLVNGAVAGWNFPTIVRNIGQGKIGGLSRSPNEKTEFSELSATWTIVNGIASNQDLKLVSPMLKVTGTGRVLLPQRELDYAVRGKIGAMEEPQAGGGANLSGLEIPVKVTGNWQRPQLQPDVNAVLKDPNQAIGAAKEILKSDKAKNFLKNLLGK